MKKLFKVEVSKELWVFAENQSKAEEIAIENIDGEGMAFEAFSFEITKEAMIPEEIKDSLVWGEKEDITVLESFRKSVPIPKKPVPTRKFQKLKFQKLPGSR